MKYPMKEVFNPFGGTTYREMTPQEYEDQLQFYDNYVRIHRYDSSRTMQDYVHYLLRWFDEDEACDGCDSLATRLQFHRLPMTPNQFMFE